MGHNLIKYILFVLILSTQACRTMPWVKPEEVAIPENPVSADQQQIIRLLRQGDRYEALNSAERLVVCKRLLLDYQQQADWQTAWLLIYALNDKFSCVGQKETIKLLHAIQEDKGTSPSLLWINRILIPNYKSLRTLQLQLNKYYSKNKGLRTQLQDAETQLQQVISKIQALKEIETSINKKLDDEPTIK